ncbi:MAG TPA: site-specific integrase [Oculatellaceae cyanobacterium]
MEKFFEKPKAMSDLRSGPLAPYLDAFALALHNDGYAVSTGRFQLQIFGDFSRWLECNGIRAEQVTREHGIGFMRHRDKTRSGRRADAEAAINRLLEFLNELQVTPAVLPKPLSELEKVAEEFAEFLSDQRGLSEKTIGGYQRMSLQFLRTVAQGDEFDGESLLNAANIYSFVQQHAAIGKTVSGDVLNAVRAFLRFAHFRGYAIADLADIVPRAASWSLAKIPKSVSPAQIEKVLSTCDRATPYGKRDFAILLLLARLGLRIGEVAALSLDDIDWETGTLIVRGKSGPRTLPVPKDVGEALAQYLSEVRPATKSRSVFFRLRAPIRPMKSHESFSGVVRRAMQQARIKSNGRGAHQFRHGLATELLRRGASIPEIGEILGHQRMESTMIYAKVDLISLRKIAKRWPGGV